MLSLITPTFPRLPSHELTMSVLTLLALTHNPYPNIAMQLDIDMSPPLDWEVLEGRTWYWRRDFPYFCPLLPPQAPLTLDLHLVSCSCVWADTKREMATNILSWAMERVLQKVILPMC